MRNDVNVHTFINPLIDERMYLMIQNESAIIVDPFESSELVKILNIKKAKAMLVLLTHEHYDHISGVNFLKQNFIFTKSMASKQCKDNIVDFKKNRTKYFPLLFLNNSIKYHELKKKLAFPYYCTIDLVFNDTIMFDWNGFNIFAKSVGGHSEGSSIYIINDSCLFAGDNLLGNGEEMKSYHADVCRYTEKIIPFFQSLDLSMPVYPGHGDSHSLDYFMNIVTKDGYIHGN